MRGILGMDENYTFRQFDHDLNQGFKIYLTFIDNRYLIYKSNTNCYTQELVDYDEKNPQPRLSMITRKRLREIHKYSKDFEYKM